VAIKAPIGIVVGLDKTLFAALLQFRDDVLELLVGDERDAASKQACPQAIGALRRQPEP